MIGASESVEYQAKKWDAVLDAYLEIAAKILKAEMRPLSPKAILAEAYRRSLVPTHLHGQTQHKTLQARLSEDIIERREQSLFFRTAPGRFFLRTFITDTSIPNEFRQPFPTRRRIRELVRGPALAVEYDALAKIAQQNIALQPRKIIDLLNSERSAYEDPRRGNQRLVFLRSFVCVCRENEVLSYRVGRYRDDRDSFMFRRSIGFSTFVHREEHTLFSLDDLGIVDSGIKAAQIDLDIPYTPDHDLIDASLGYFVWCTAGGRNSDLLAIIRFECPSWFEPIKRRLALNDPAWLSTKAPINDLDDFDPWSKTVLLTYYKVLAASGGKFGSHSSSIRQTEHRLHQVSNRDG